MGKLKELLDKQAKGELTEDEEKELKELQADFAEIEDKKSDEADEEKELDEAATKFADMVNEKVKTTLEDITKKMEVKEVETKEAPTVIVDKKYGSKTVQELDDIKIKLGNRQDKVHQEISAKSLHFVTALITGDVQKLQLLNEGTGSAGGFLVPDDFANMIVEDIRDVSVMRQIADVLTTTSDTFHLPNLASRPKAAWRSEGAVKATSTAVFGETVFTPYSLAAIVPLTNELVADASLGVGSSIVTYVSQLIAQACAEEEEKAFWTGNGSGKPTGITTYSVGTIAAGGTDSLKADAIINTYMRLPQGYRSRGVWVGNSSTVETTQTLKDSQGNYLVARLTESPVLTLKGRPVYEQNDLPDGTLYYGDFSYYKIVDREGIQTRISDEATVAGQSAFERNLTFVRVEKRVDGELTLTQAIRSVTGL